MMKHSVFSLSASAAAMMLLSASSAFAAGDAKGVWMDDSGRGAVEIKPCGTALCGHVVAVKNANDAKGCGKQIIGDVQSSGNGIWDGGWIYSPEKRKNYDVELKPLADGTLRVVGYAGTKFFSRTMIWTRAPQDLQRCDRVAAAPATPQPVAPVPVAAEPAAVPAAAAPSAAPAATPNVKAETAAAAKPKADTPPAAAAPAPAEAKAAAAPPAGAKSEQPAKQAPASAPAPVADAADDSDDDDAGGEKPGKRTSGGGLKIGDLDLDKVLTRTKSGRCKLDLPWVKVQFDCERD